MDFLKVSDMTTLPRPSDSQQDSSFGHPHAITPYAANGVLGCYYYHPFTNAQLKELERQAMIYKYMIASVPVPFDLLVSSSSASPCGNKNMAGGDLEPGRCRRTDGKKWRCSKEVVPNHKYCERHLHRGRPRSRKHVEPPYSRPLKEPKEISKSISNYRESRGSETLPALAITEQENKYLNFIDIWSEKQSTTPTTPVSSSSNANANLSLHSLDLSMGGNNLMGLAVTGSDHHGYGPYGITSSLEEMSSWLAPAPSATPGGPLAEILWPNPSLESYSSTATPKSSPSRAIKKMTGSVSDQSSQM